MADPLKATLNEGDSREWNSDVSMILCHGSVTLVTMETRLHKVPVFYLRQRRAIIDPDLFLSRRFAREPPIR